MKLKFLNQIAESLGSINDPLVYLEFIQLCWVVAKQVGLSDKLSIVLLAFQVMFHLEAGALLNVISMFIFFFIYIFLAFYFIY